MTRQVGSRRDNLQSPSEKYCCAVPVDSVDSPCSAHPQIAKSKTRSSKFRLWKRKRQQKPTARPSPAFSKNGRLPSAWMDVGAHWTTSSSKDCGAASNTKRSICTTTKVSPKQSRAWANTSTSTTTSGFISHSITKPRQPFITGDRPKNGSPAIHLNFPVFLSRQWGTP